MINPIAGLIAWRRRRELAALLQRPLLPTRWEEHWIPVDGGTRVHAHLHRPVDADAFPGVVMVPGGASKGTDYDRGRFLRADELASLGFLVVHYDPRGRGRTGGREDHWGTVHQDELAQVLRWLGGHDDLSPQGLAVFSISIGITMASGALARHPDPQARLLFDWEGPSSRAITTRQDTHKPLAGFPMSNDAFWREREAVAFIGAITCGYYRFQGAVDHVQGRFKGHALELVNAATRGRAAWTRCNDNPLNLLLEEDKLEQYRWAGAGYGEVARGFLSAWETALAHAPGTRDG